MGKIYFSVATNKDNPPDSGWVDESRAFPTLEQAEEAARLSYRYGNTQVRISEVSWGRDSVDEASLGKNKDGKTRVKYYTLKTFPPEPQLVSWEQD